MKLKFEDFEIAHGTLYKHYEGEALVFIRYYRLCAKGVTPNGCWLINPCMREVEDIDIATATDIYGMDTYQLENGTVPASIPYKRVD